MKIKEKLPTRIPFGDLAVGDVFRDNTIGSLYMKVREMDNLNAVCLSAPYVTRFRMFQ